MKRRKDILIPVSKATEKALGIRSFDPLGTIRFEDDRWVRIYKLDDKDKSFLPPDVFKAELLVKADSRVRVTTKLMKEESITFLTLTQTGADFNEVKDKFEKDEELLFRYSNFVGMDIDGIINEIAVTTEHRDISYASLVRGRKNWKEEIFPKIDAQGNSFRMSGEYGECCLVLQFPQNMQTDIFSKLREIGCPFWTAYDIQQFQIKELNDFNRAIEQKYNRKIRNTENRDFASVSLQLLFKCDSDDARAIVEKTIFKMFSDREYVLAPCIGMQRKSAESMISLGIVDQTYMRIVSKKNASEIYGMEGFSIGSN